MIAYRFEWIKLEDLLVVKGHTYVTADAVNNAYKTLEGKTHSTQRKLLRDLKVKQCITVKQPCDSPAHPRSCKTMFINLFKRYQCTTYIPINELSTPKEGPNKQSHVELLRRICLIPIVKSNDPYDESIDDYDANDLSISTYFDTG